MHSRLWTLPILMPLCLFFLLIIDGQAQANEEELVYYSTDDIEITEFDRKMYLRKSPPVADGSVGSRARNLQALSDLYALKVLFADAQHLQLLTDKERDWIANYEIGLEIASLYIEFEVQRRLSATDWDAEALEAYLADPSGYTFEERVSIRTLLIRTDERSEDEAIEMVSDLRSQALLLNTSFEALVRARTEDVVARENGGLMEDIRRGDTVPPFERAAFALREPGALSEPVVSQFGVHLIQLLEYESSRQQTFEEVKQQIIDQLVPRRTAEYREAIQHEARERTPEGFIEHTDALDALMSRTSDGPLGGN